MPNPLYILQLTDFHIRKIKETGKFSFDETKRKRLFKNFTSFFKNRNTKSFDIVCITGDMVDRNMGSQELELAIKFIGQLKNEEFISNKTNVYVCPGNHDIDVNQSIKLGNLNGKRKAILKNQAKPLYKLVDSYSKRLKKFYQNYKYFVDEINAKNLSATYNNGDLNYFLGYDEIPLIDDKLIFVSWFNTSWLCLRDIHWENDIFQINNEEREKNGFPKIRINDNDKISPGYKINKPIFDRFDNLDPEKTIFKLGLVHHETRLLSLHDKIQLKNKKNKECFYNHLKKYSLILNGHTHSDMFDNPFLTSTGDYESKVLNFVPILEVNLLKNLITHYPIPLSSKFYFNVDPNQNELRISAFNDKKLLAQSKSKFNRSELVDELKWNNFDSYTKNPQFYKLESTIGRNCLTDSNYCIQDESIQILFNK